MDAFLADLSDKLTAIQQSKDDLTRQNHLLKQQVHFLTLENAALKQQLHKSTNEEQPTFIWQEKLESKAIIDRLNDHITNLESRYSWSLLN